MSLLDVNVWLASSWRNHESHERVTAWVQRGSEGLVMCRVTQMGFLRLSTVSAIAGPDTLTRRALADFERLGVRVEFFAAEDACVVCAALRGNVHDPRTAPPIPVPGCLNDLCRCDYMPVP